LNQQVLIVDALILASAALSIPSRGLKYCKEIQIPYGKLLVPFQHGASLKRNLKIAQVRMLPTIAVYAAHSIQSCLHFLGKSSFWKHLHLP